MSLPNIETHLEGFVKTLKNINLPGCVSLKSLTSKALTEAFVLPLLKNPEGFAS